MFPISQLLSALRGTLSKFSAVSGSWFILILLWIVILIAVWWALPHLEINGYRLFTSQGSRIIFTLLWLLLMLVVILWRLWYRIRKLTRQPVQPARPDQHAAATASQQRYLDGWLQALHHYAGSGAKYRLPWYLIVGLPASGKTSLIHRVNSASRLNIRLNSELRDLAKDQYMDIWLGDQAVIFDPAGRLLVQQGTDDEQQEETASRLWHHLLRWLNDNRSRQPLNGIVLTLDLAWLAQSCASGRKAYAQLMRERLLEISATLNTRLPLYIVLTRLDMLRGFEHFYPQTDSHSRDSLLGVTFSMQAGEADLWMDELDQFWQQWISRLNGQLAQRLLDSSGEPRIEAALFSFIRQLDGIKDYISAILDDMIIREPHHLLRVCALCLSSVYQQGVPFDVFSRGCTQRYHLPETVWPARRGESAVFFVRRLFTDIVFPQAHLAGESRLHQLYRRRRLLAAFTLMVSGALALMGSWQYYYRVNHRAAGQVLEKSRQFIAAKDSSGDRKSGVDQLLRLNLIRDATLAFGDYRDKSFVFADMGLYQGGKIGAYVESSYLKMLQLQFLPAVMQGLAEDLASAAPLSEQKLNILRVMRMIEDASGRNKALTEQFMAQRWQRIFPQQGQIQQQLMQHLDYALDHTDWHQAKQHKDTAAITAWQPFAAPVQQAQTELRKLPLFLRVYQRLDSQAAETLPAALHIRDEVGQSYDSVFSLRNSDAGSIPRFYSWRGFSGDFTGRRDSLLNITAEDAWVLGLRENVHLSDADWQEIQRQVQEKYITGYINRWQALLANLEIQPLKTPEQALHVLGEISGSEQPFRRVIATLSDNTHERDDGENPVNSQISRRISVPFTALNNTLHVQGEAAPVIQDISRKLLAVRQWLEQIITATDPGQAALKAIQKRLADPYGDPLALLQQYARTLPAPLNRWTGQIADQTSALVVSMALSSLNESWQHSVVTPFNLQLADRYPFDPASDQDVPLSEMEKFFASGGTLDSFYRSSVKPLVDAGLLSSQSASQQQRELFRQLTRAEHIRDTLFNAQGGLEYHFVLEPLELTANKRRSVLNLDGQLVDYSHGSRQKIPLVWPNSIRAGSVSKLTLVPDNRRQSPRSLTFTGPWSMFRLLESGELSRITAESFDVRLTTDNGSVTYRVHTDENHNLFSRDMFSQFRLPESLYNSPATGD